MPRDLCVCGDMDDSLDIYISNDRRRYGKVVTLVEFSGNSKPNLNDILKEAKRKLGSGGTIRDEMIEIRGDHRFKIKKLLIDYGFDSDNIFIKE